VGAISTILNTTYKLGKKKADEVEKIIKDNGYKITKIKQKDPNKKPNPSAFWSKTTAAQDKMGKVADKGLYQRQRGAKLITKTAIIGFLAGSGLTGDVQKTGSAKENGNGRVNPKDYPTYKKGTDSSKAFQEAFRQAVKDKKKTFTFEGRVYNTKKK
tara:strand:- start:196 stop:666 length:471 start_codon:yes stop_codon:yes gene_type:complete